MSEGLDGKNQEIKEEETEPAEEEEDEVMHKATFADDRKTRKQRTRERQRLEEVREDIDYFKVYL